MSDDDAMNGTAIETSEAAVSAGYPPALLPPTVAPSGSSTAVPALAAPGERHDREVSVLENMSRRAGTRLVLHDPVTGPWQPAEDELLIRIVNQHGPRNWNHISARIPGRFGKSCRLRWCNQLDPVLKRSPFTEIEDQIIINAYRLHGSRWSLIAKLLEGRTDNSIKNHWNATLRRRYIADEKSKDFPEKAPSIDAGCNNLPAYDTILDASIEKSRGFSERSPSVEQSNSLEVQEPNLIEHIPDDSDNAVQVSKEPLGSEVKNSSYLFRPVPRPSAFSPYTRPPGQPIGTNLRRPAQTAIDAQRSKLMGPEPIVPSRCGHGCGSTANPQRSSLGPEFSEFLECPPIADQELAFLTSEGTAFLINDSTFQTSGSSLSTGGGDANFASDTGTEST